MRLGICSNWGADVEAYRTEIRTAAEHGFEVVGIGDSPAGWQDLIVSMTLATIDAPNATISPMVTSPFLRHPLVSAGAMCSLDSLAPGRIAYGLATGGSTVIALGRGRATQSEIRAEFAALKGLFAGQSIEWEGRKVSPLRFARPIPIYYSAFGPKAIALAGELADGVILFAGAEHLDDLRSRIAALSDAAVAAGRRASEIDIWVISFASVRPTRAQAIADLKAFISVNALTIAMSPERLGQAPEHLRDQILEYQRRYDVTKHVVVGGSNSALMDELGLTDYLASFDTTMGDVPTTAGVLRELAAMGVSTFIASLPGHAAPLETIRGIAAARAAM
jgi:alkanesulfonate monooxygenase SsuD/methylene tetrahydromethanopterin reductase-like flavin-dependent oxidoreductase (luciferase family)